MNTSITEQYFWKWWPKIYNFAKSAQIFDVNFHLLIKNKTFRPIRFIYVFWKCVVASNYICDSFVINSFYKFWACILGSLTIVSFLKFLSIAVISLCGWFVPVSTRLMLIDVSSIHALLNLMHVLRWVEFSWSLILTSTVLLISSTYKSPHLRVTRRVAK